MRRQARQDHRRRGALFNPHCATIPARLARGLARAVGRLGGEIFERTPVTDYEEVARTLGPGRGRTRAWCARARSCSLVRPTWRGSASCAAKLPHLLLIVLTESLSEERWAGIGWEGRECVASNRYTVDYLSRTEERWLGGRGAPYHYGSRVRRV